jgi:hypothetical protein
MSFFMAHDQHRFNYDAEVIRRARALEPRHFLRASCYSGGKLATHKKSVSGDNAPARFYEVCGLSPATIEGAIKARYEISTTIANRDRAVAVVMAQRLREQIVKVGTRRKRQDGVAVSASQHLLYWNDASLYALN